MKQIRTTAKADGLHAFVVLNKEGVQVATVHILHRESSTRVDIFHTGPVAVQQGKASGGGYDRATHAMSGLVVDGHTLTDHCEERLDPPHKEGFPRNGKAPEGYHYANLTADGMFYRDCYKVAGLDYLSELEYRVIRAL